MHENMVHWKYQLIEASHSIIVLILVRIDN